MKHAGRGIRIGWALLMGAAAMAQPPAGGQAPPAASAGPPAANVAQPEASAAAGPDSHHLPVGSRRHRDHSRRQRARP